MPIIHVSAGLLTDSAGRILLVRKRGTTAFMQPGGKPEPGESPLQAMIRELHEELGVLLAEPRWDFLGEFLEQAANEPGHQVAAHAFAATLTADEIAGARAAAEIEESAWFTPDQARGLDLAPLTRFALLPLLDGGGPGQRPDADGVLR